MRKSDRAGRDRRALVVEALLEDAGDARADLDLARALGLADGLQRDRHRVRGAPRTAVTGIGGGAPAPAGPGPSFRAHAARSTAQAMQDRRTRESAGGGEVIGAEDGTAGQPTGYYIHSGM